MHQYDAHPELKKKLLEKYLGYRSEPALDCSQFDLGNGDIQGSDLSHAAVESEEGCCVACIQVSQCGGFVYSPSANHCWLKTPGAFVTGRTHSRNNVDSRAGLKKG